MIRNASTASSGIMLSDETFFPYNFTMIDLPQAKVTISNITMVTMDSEKSLTVNVS